MPDRELKICLGSSIFIILILCIVFLGEAGAAPYHSYTYDYWGEPVPAPQAYLPLRIVDSDVLGLELNRPTDLHVYDNRIYLLDSGNDRLVIIDESWSLVNVIDVFENNQKEDSFQEPRGIFANRLGIYVADRDNSRIIHLDLEGQFLREIGEPETEVEGVLPPDFDFRPHKVGVDHAGRVYVLAEGVYDGILEFDVDGNFQGFLGAPRVSPSVIDYLWRQVATEEQRARMALFLPVEHSNIEVDDRGFIYATVTGGALGPEERVRRLNPSGQDVLRRMGFHPPVGDYGDDWIDEETGAQLYPPSSFIDIAPREYGKYSVLDRERSRVFTYDTNGNLLYVFGGRGEQKGLVRTPAALDTFDDYILVLDRRRAAINVYRPTEYASLIHAAIQHYNHGRYDLATEKWKEVLIRNNNYDLAYTGIGRSLLRQGEYHEAMINFRLGQNRAQYSEAFMLYRRDILAENFGFTMALLISFIFLYMLTKRFILPVLRRRYPSQSMGTAQAAVSQTVEEVLSAENFSFGNLLSFMLKNVLQSIRYSFHVILHPFDGFWNLKHERKGNLLSASFLLFMVCLTYIVVRQYTGFIFNPWDVTRLNIFLEISSVFMPFILWCVTNWALTTLMDGKGTLRDVYIASAFALTPIIVTNIPMTIISNFITMDEGAFYYVVIAIGVIWSLCLLFFGTMVTHDYDIPKTLGTTLLIIFGMAMIIFIGMLFFSIIDHLMQFLLTLRNEIIFRA